MPLKSLYALPSSLRYASIGALSPCSFVPMKVNSALNSFSGSVLPPVSVFVDDLNQLIIHDHKPPLSSWADRFVFFAISAASIFIGEFADENACSAFAASSLFLYGLTLTPLTKFRQWSA